MIGSNGTVRKKSFTTPEINHEPGPEFDLDGESFRCVRVAPPAVLAAMLNSIEFGGSGETQFRIAGILAFLGGVVADAVWERSTETVEEGGQPEWKLVDVDDWSRWQNLVRDRNRQVPIEVLGEIVGWLAEEYLERPTVAP